MLATDWVDGRSRVPTAAMLERVRKLRRERVPAGVGFLDEWADNKAL
jgi:hypothetical protein